MKNPKIRKQLLLAATALSFAAAPLFADTVNKTVNSGATYTTQENKVTEGTIVVDGSWTPASGDCAIANTKRDTDEYPYGLISVTVGATGKIATEGAAEVFKFFDFTGSQTSEGATFFRLENSGTISSAAERVFQFANKKGPVIKGVVEIKNLSAGTISGYDDVLKLAGKIIFDNAGTVASSTGQVLDFGTVNTAAVSEIRNTGTLTSAGNEVISGPANMKITNSGKIETTDAASSAIKVKVADDGVNVSTAASANLVLENLAGGEIIGTKHGVTGDRASEITNAGTIAGKGGSGVNWDGDVADSPDGGTSFYGNAYFVVKVTNLEGGVISGNGDNASLDGDGVDVDYGVELVNAGTISAKDSPVSADGLAIGGGSVKNLATGKITASNACGAAYGILADDSNGGNAFAALSIENAGTIETTGSATGAAIKIVSDKRNTITNSGKILSSSGTAIALGDGGDTIVVQGGEIVGAIVGGAGKDSLVVELAGESAEFTIADAVSSVENLEIRAGTLVLKSTISGVETLRFVQGEDGGFGKIEVADAAAVPAALSEEGAPTVPGISFSEGAVLEIVLAENAALTEGAELGSLLSGFALADVGSVRIFQGDTDVSSAWTLGADASGSLSLIGVPEPSAFGLLAGTAALAFAASRRRRRGNG